MNISKRFWINLILLAVTGGLVYIIWYLPAERTLPQRLFVTAPYQANSIRIQRQGKADIYLHKQGMTWQLQEPGIAAVNPDRIKHLLTILNEPVLATYTKAGKDLSDFGLKPGKIKLTINREEATFGSTNPVTLNRYILKNNKIYTIREIVYGVLGGSVTALLAHRLLPPGYEITHIDAPGLFSKVPLRLWQEIEAIDIADREGDETVVGKIQFILHNKAPNQSEKYRISFDIIAIKPFLVLGRQDLNVKYTFDNTAMMKLTGKP